MRKTFCFAIAICLLGFGQAFAGKMLWEKKLDSEIRFKMVHDTGIIVVGTKDEVYGFEPETGNMKWHIDKLMKNYEPNMVTPQPGSPFMVYVYKEGFTDFQPSIRCLNIVTGELVWEWDTGDAQPDMKDQIAALLGTTSGPDESAIVVPNGWPLPINNVLPDDERNQFLLSSTGIMVGVGKKVHNPLLKKEMVNAKPKAFDDGAIVAVDQKTGKVKWLGYVPKERKAKLSYTHSPPLVIGDKVVLTWAGAHIFDANTGKFLGGAEFSREGGKGSKSEAFDDNTVYLSAKETIVAVDLNSGAIKWESEKFKDHVPYMEVVGDKIVAQIGGAYPDKDGKVEESKNTGILIIDKNSGKCLNDYKNDNKKIEMTTPFYIDSSMAYFATANSFRCYDINALSYKFAVDLGKLNKGDSPKGLQKQDDKICLTTSLSTFAFDNNGNELWSKSYKAPGVGKFAAIALMAAQAIEVAGAYQRAYQYGGSHKYKVFLGSALSQRWTAAEASGAYNYVMADLDGKPTVVGVSLKTGEADRKAQLENKEADYIVDEIGGFLVNVKGEKELQIFDLKTE